MPPGHKNKSGLQEVLTDRFGAPDRIRTYDLPVRSRALYPLSYRRIWSG